MFCSSYRKFVCLVIASVFSFESWATAFREPVGSVPQPIQSAQALDNASAYNFDLFGYKAQAKVDPLWDEFIRTPVQGLKINVNSNDMALDQDPFFLRSSSWIPGSRISRSYEYKSGPNDLIIKVPNSSRQLSLKVPLQPLQMTDQWLFFSLKSNSDAFTRINGEGIFFIDKEELFSLSMMEAPVPVYFFPLAGRGWQGALDSLYLPQANRLVIANQNDVVSLDLLDVDTLMKAQRMNLSMAMTSTLRITTILKIPPSQYPARGMTASFGLLFTGIDLDHLNHSYWAKTTPVEPNFLEKSFASLVSKLNLYGAMTTTKSHASGSGSDDVLERLAWVGSILAVMLAASVIIKYAHPGVRKKVESLRKGPQPWDAHGIVKREIKEIFDVYASTLGASLHFAPVTFANALEMFIDRTMPSIGAGEHTFLRKFLNNTLFYDRNSVRQVPTNAKVLFLGAVVMGSVDTGLVYIQYKWAIPAIADAASPYLPIEMQKRIEMSFSLKNPHYDQLLTSDTLRNGIAHAQGGATAYSGESRLQVIGPITKEVQNEMKAQGKDILDPKNENWMHAEIEKRVDAANRIKGLPDSSEFKFDANNLFSNISKVMGHISLQASGDPNETYILQKRMMLKYGALDKAILVAKKLSDSHNSPALQNAIEILEETRKNLSVTKALLLGIKESVGEEFQDMMSTQRMDFSKPTQSAYDRIARVIGGVNSSLQKVRQTNLQLSLLSYAGSIDYYVKNIPNSWTRYSEEGARMAGLLFREALFSYLFAEGDNLLRSNSEDKANYERKAEAKVIDDLRNFHPSLQGKSDEEVKSQLSANDKTELALRKVIEINRMVAEQIGREKAESYAPPKRSWFEQRRIRKAEIDAEQKLMSFLEEKQNQLSLTEKELEKLKSDFYARSLAEQIGMRIETSDSAKAAGKTKYAEMLVEAENTAARNAMLEITSDRNTRTYYEKLSETEKSQFRTHLYGVQLISEYKKITTESEELSAIDQAMPGMFQKFRQKEWVSRSPTLTRMVRFVESIGDDQEIGLGLRGTLGRKFPLYNDLASNHVRMFKRTLSLLTISYGWNYYFWHVNMSYSSWMIMTALVASTMRTPDQWLNRAMRFVGVKPAGGVGSKSFYAFLFGWVTFLGVFPIAMYSPDLGQAIKSMTTPVQNWISHVSIYEWIGMAGTMFSFGYFNRSRLNGTATVNGDKQVNSKRFKLVEKLKPESASSNRCSEVLMAR